LSGANVAVLKGGKILLTKREEHAAWPFDESMTHHDLLSLQDKSGLPRDEFYMRYIGALDAEGSVLELDSVSM
jgi:hypothetical protein